MDEQDQDKELEPDGQVAKPEETPGATPGPVVGPSPAGRYEDPHPPDGALYDTVAKVWVDRKNHIALRDQHPGEPDSDYVGKHDINDGDDVADGLKKR